MTLFNKNLITPDLIFSYWIFTVFIIYYLLIIFNIKTYFNPLLALYISLFFNLIQIIYIFCVTYNFNLFFKFLFMMIIFKGIPIYLIRNKEIIVKRDLIHIFILFIIYNIYLFCKGTNIITINKRINESLIKKQNTTIFFAILKYFNL